ncbi:8-amino-7-oxononanoate synthase [Candidatus Methylobacter oryzae]|uniref:8-amino-7-oxononanoate synthase n=1 Tax=Candidatus Methylobacter oryzae TaxID=2497749 RepID=A0ABY3CC84_9GAMM|nr:8-amino-7-oxononanoate synthase [Candidatus Methylobacter oryzae]TRW96478.1 8-amino-7-oxononanoate synthase [Candidatus Methylobacter oryzae]
MAHPFPELAAGLDDIARQGLYRSRRVSESPQGINLEINGRHVVNFCSNDYLGLANHPEVVDAFKAGVDRYGVGSGSAHLICGHSAAHHALEEELAAFTGRDRALLFSTGYMANIGAISALLGRGDSVFEDRLNHASLLDGGLFSGARFKRYAHADAADLHANLDRAVGNKLVVTDGVFSMDGDFAPLDELALTAKKHNAWLMVDDAHGLGVIGEHGGGVVEHFGLDQDDVPVLMGTLGKGFGTFGAFIAGSETLIETLIQRARTYIYTTALPAAVAEATRASLRLGIEESWRRDKLKQLSERFRMGAEQVGLQVMPSASAIQPILIGGSQAAVDISNELLDAGFLVSAIRPPTVPQGSARLRVTFSALHEQRHVDGLLDALVKITLGRK